MDMVLTAQVQIQSSCILSYFLCLCQLFAWILSQSYLPPIIKFPCPLYIFVFLRALFISLSICFLNSLYFFGYCFIASLSSNSRNIILLCKLFLFL